MNARAEDVGRVCPYCRFPLKADNEVEVCDDCGAVHHTDCWQDGEGCAVVGCGAGLANPAAEPTRVMPPPPLPPPIDPKARRTVMPPPPPPTGQPVSTPPPAGTDGSGNGGYRAVIILLVLVILAMAAVGAYFLTRDGDSTRIVEGTVASTSESTSTTPEPQPEPPVVEAEPTRALFSQYHREPGYSAPETYVAQLASFRPYERQEAADKAEELTGQGISSWILKSDNYNPPFVDGYWVVYAGPTTESRALRLVDQSLPMDVSGPHIQDLSEE